MLKFFFISILSIIGFFFLGIPLYHIIRDKIKDYKFKKRKEKKVYMRDWVKIVENHTKNK